MAYIDYTKKDRNTSAEQTLCLTSEECELLIPTLRKLLQKAVAKHEKYMDIQDSGEATTAQQNKLIQYKDERDTIKDILDKAETLQNINYNSKHGLTSK